jgi:hypothetical protein
MNNFAFAARSCARNVLLGSILTLGLVACGSDDGSSSSATASTSDPVPSLVAPNVGVIDRSTGETTAGTATAATTGSAPSSASATPSVGATTGTVASNNKVSPPPKSVTGTATLDWMPPTENSDGSVLTNLAGYTVYYGTSPDSLTRTVKVTNPGLTAYTMSNLPSGTWYFAVTAYSSSGTESARSGVVKTTI